MTAYVYATVKQYTISVLIKSGCGNIKKLCEHEGVNKMFCVFH